MFNFRLDQNTRQNTETTFYMYKICITIGGLSMLGLQPRHAFSGEELRKPLFTKHTIDPLAIQHGYGKGALDSLV